MLSVLLSAELQLGYSDLSANLSKVGFYVPVYMGPRDSLELIAQMPNLEVVQLLTVGVDAALEYVPEHVSLCNAVGVHDASTAELAVALVLASLRGIDDFARAMPHGEWIHDRRSSLVDRNVLIIGAGGVGQAIAHRLIPFGAEVTLVARSQRPGVVASSELPSLLPEADIVVLAVPLNMHTSGLVDDSFLSRMREGSLLVNVARGGVVDTQALVRHAQQGRIRAALDVTDPEPLPPEHPLWRIPGVLISPHVGGNTSAFLPRARALVEQQISRWRSKDPLMHVVQR
ncbi:MAG: 2-hydroxyacid dehydrogenase [Actinomycetales bacterium]|jgi:phosphoglycerate dehydrogenase-like enzyme|nr:2-hydroxyacid dehydrogenase [Actinomycetales bacterium]|tara:strand:- start:1711 stop:2571 length:861 start_codon:yes stop_codon:yes gene_type:complete